MWNSSFPQKKPKKPQSLLLPLLPLKKKIHNNQRNNKPSWQNIENKRSKHWKQKPQTQLMNPAVNHEPSRRTHEPSQWTHEPANPSGKPTNPSGETHESKLGLNPRMCDSLDEGRFPSISLFFYADRVPQEIDTYKLNLLQWTRV